MPSRKRKMNDDHAALIKRMGSLGKKRDDAASALSVIDEEIIVIQHSLSEELAEGNYTAGRWVCKVTDKEITGRSSTSWKTVATAIKGGLNQIKQEHVEKFPEATSALKKMAKRIHGFYDDTLDANTKVGPDRIDVQVSVERLSSKK